MALLKRLVDTERAPVAFVLDGKACEALQGDTVLTAVLTQAERLRQSEFSGRPRAGFCMMGACQDCWVRTEDGRRLRACSTFIEDGMRVVTTIAGVPVANPAAPQAAGQTAAWPEDVS